MTKEEILKKHWAKETIQPFDEVVIHHLSYALNAMEEFSQQSNKELLSKIDELKYERDSYKESFENCKQMNERLVSHIHNIRQFINNEQVLNDSDEFLQSTTQEKG